MKPYDGGSSPHDLTTYGGRVAHFFDMVDLRNAFVSDADIAGASSLLDAHKRGAAPPGTTDAALWNARKSASARARMRRPCSQARARAHRNRARNVRAHVAHRPRPRARVP